MVQLNTKKIKTFQNDQFTNWIVFIEKKAFKRKKSLKKLTTMTTKSFYLKDAN